MTLEVELILYASNLSCPVSGIAVDPDLLIPLSAFRIRILTIYQL